MTCHGRSRRFAADIILVTLPERYHSARRLRSISCRIIGVKINCMASGIFEPGQAGVACDVDVAVDHAAVPGVGEAIPIAAALCIYETRKVLA